MEKLFEQILDKDEKIIKVVKPNKKKIYWSAFIYYTFIMMWFAIMGIVGVLSDWSIDSNQKSLLLMAIVGAFLLLYFVMMIFVKIYYSKLYYAYSNKRIIIRTGIFGVDFKSLDMSMVGAINVYVSLLDKILRKNTGSITFGSTASPLTYSNAGGATPYKFANITQPYELYREVKNVIDEYKESKLKK